MKRNRRWAYKARNADSKWEQSLKDGVLSKLKHHPDPLEYTVSHKYTPDFVDSANGYIIEAKGRFMDSTEASKYKWIRSALPDNMELIFLFMKPLTPMPHAKKRKDGTKLSHGEWAEKNGFRYFTEETIMELWNE